jgi:thiosulfate dehydrogenase
VALLGAAAACSGGADAPVAARDFGAELFRSPSFSESAFNHFSCATCHRTTPDDPSPRVGGTLYDVAARPSFWGGHAPRLIDAVSHCNFFFMRGPQLIDPEDPRGRALYEYLVAISPGSSAAVRPMTFVENVGDLARGDPARGRVAYDAACRSCHGAPHSGSGRMYPEVPIIPEASIGFGVTLGADPDLVVIEKVRHGRFYGVGGEMPPFSREALSDADLGAILAYLGL